jgi:hypothetical protein
MKATTPKRKTRTILGHEITLVPGVRYLASRPMATRGRKMYPVNICDISNGWSDHPVLTLPEMTYDEANDFLAAFNNGTTSFEGRIW